jgi:hypothetical protein
MATKIRNGFNDRMMYGKAKTNDWGGYTPNSYWVCWCPGGVPPGQDAGTGHGNCQCFEKDDTSSYA